MLYSVKFFIDLNIVHHGRFCKRFFNIFIFIFRLFPVIGFDGAANFVEKVHGNLAGGAAQVVQDGGGGELGNARKVLVLQILAGVQAAAGQDGKLDAGGQEVFIAYLQIEVVQFLQEAVPRVIAQVLQIVPIGPAYGAADLFHERPANIMFLCGAVLPFQCRRNSAGFLRRHLPQIRLTRPTDGAGVSYVKDIFQARPPTRTSPNEGDPLGTGFHPPPHGVVPQFHAGAGGGVRALGVDQKLFIKAVFLKILSRGNVRLNFYLFSFLYSFKGNRRHSYRGAAVIISIILALPPGHSSVL